MKCYLFEDKTRWQHFLYAIPIAFVFTFLCTLGVAFALEFKDYKWGGKWDWKDLICTLLGGLVGQGLQVLLLFLIL
jgi:hypothetical protein